MLKPTFLFLSIIILLSFFLPWINVASPVVGGISKILTGKRQANIDSISGFDIPVLANSSESRFMINVIQIFNPGIKHANKKSFLVWAIPIFAIFLSIVFHLFYENRWINFIITILTTSIFVLALYKIKTTDLDKLVLQVNIALGFWSILYAYLGMGLISFLNFCRITQRMRENEIPKIK